MNEKYADRQRENNNQWQCGWHMQIAIVIEIRATRKLINYVGETFKGLPLFSQLKEARKIEWKKISSV